VAECRTVPCVEEWREIENEPDITYGEWGSCSPGEVSPSTVESLCSKKRTVTIVYTEQSSCSKATRKGRTVVREESEPCACPCVETQEPRETPGSYSWAPAILQGQCQQERFPQVDTFTPALNCHQLGTQNLTLDWLCKADEQKSIDLCRNVSCPTPPPTCDNTAAYYKNGANGGLFNLQNSGSAAELAWVNSYVGLGPWEKFDDEGDKDDDCTGADVSAKVVIVKAGSSQSTTWSYKTYLNVTQGQQLCTYGGKDISHVAYFRCD
jgi:hypothetical protein